MKIDALMPKKYNDRMNKPEILKPADPYGNNLPPDFQSVLNDNYHKALGSIMANSSILRRGHHSVSGPSPSEKQNLYQMRSRSNLTNADHYAMSKNHLLLASKIGELPHHYFTVEHAKLVEEFNKHINNGKTVTAI